MFQLASIFTDHMVIQRGEPFRVFGSAENSGTLTLTIGGPFGGRSWESPVTAGTFLAEFPVLPEAGAPGEPFDLTLRYTPVVPTAVPTDNPLAEMPAETTDVTLHNVVLGEVWIAGGQSNMEMPLFATYDGFPDADLLSDPRIRLFTVPRRPFPDASVHNWHFEDCVSDDTPWQVCTPEAALHFSAIGFYFAKQILTSTGVPVGIISCNWGGTIVETWMDYETVSNAANTVSGTEKEALSNDDPFGSHPGADGAAREYEKAMEKLDMAAYLEKYDAWQKSFREAAKGSDAVRDAREQGADGFARHAHMGNVSVYPDYGPYDPNRPACLYENMLSRIAPYSVKGVLWYQGESNGGRAVSGNYAHLFCLMVQDWRRLFRCPDLPFLVVEIAPFGNVRWNGEQGEDWGYLREQQRIAEETLAAHDKRTTALIQIGDAGDRWNIHPCNKKVVGERLARAAETVVYGGSEPYSGPVFRSAEAANGGIYVRFNHCEGGLAIRGAYSYGRRAPGNPEECPDRLTDFSLCGKDGVYHEADAEIVSPDTVFVHCDAVPEPVCVRGGFRDFPTLNLMNGLGLPASPFRTDKQF